MEEIGKGVVVACTWYCPVICLEGLRNPSRNLWCPGLVSNSAPSVCNPDRALPLFTDPVIMLSIQILRVPIT